MFVSETENDATEGWSRRVASTREYFAGLLLPVRFREGPACHGGVQTACETRGLKMRHPLLLLSKSKQVGLEGNSLNMTEYRVETQSDCPAQRLPWEDQGCGGGTETADLITQEAACEMTQGQEGHWTEGRFTPRAGWGQISPRDVKRMDCFLPEFSVEYLSRTQLRWTETVDGGIAGRGPCGVPPDAPTLLCVGLAHSLAV